MKKLSQEHDFFRARTRLRQPAAGVTAVCARAAADGLPIYLGEFGQKAESIDDTLQYNSTATFLSTAKSKCFKGAFAWRLDSAENHWSLLRADGSFRPAVELMQTFSAAAP